MNEPPPPTPDRLHELLRDVASIQRQQLRHANLMPEVQARLEEGRVASLRARLSPHRLTLPFFTAGGLGLAAAAAAVVLWLRIPAPLSFVVGQAELSGRSGEIVAAQSDGQTPVRFSDGSHLALDPGARLQVVGVAAGGATVAMERGAVEVEVVHRASTHWVIQAGPFAVTVTGTRFLLTWEPESETLSVDMHEGSVEVTGGPASAAARSGHSTVRTGQSLRVSRRTGHYELGASTGVATARALAATATATAANLPADLPADLPASAIPTAPSPAQEIAPARGPEAPAPSSAARSLRTAPLPAASDETWRRLAIAARYPEALRAVERIGFDASCRRLGAEDLVLLGDVARLAGKPARAEKAYLTARSRFPALDRPLFALGLTAFEQRHDYGRAAAWFEQYLQHYPGGALTREAAGRALESWRRAGETDRARQAARDYLARYPSGPHAALARQTIGR
jgi:ferric-dicitrate binding protein FerR (iron transport regulator)